LSGIPAHFFPRVGFSFTPARQQAETEGELCLDQEENDHYCAHWVDIPSFEASQIPKRKPSLAHDASLRNH
jgi:hypothetical protein